MSIKEILIIVNYVSVNVADRITPSDHFTLKVSEVFDVVSITQSPLSTGLIVVPIPGVIQKLPLTSSL